MNREIEYLRQPIKNSFLLNAVKGNEHNKDVLYTSVVGTPSTFVVYDVNEKKIIKSFVQGSDYKNVSTVATWTHTKDKFSNVYMASFGWPSLIFKYIVKENKLVTIGSPLNEHALFHLSTDENGNVYGGTYSAGKVFKYSPFTSDFHDYGTMVDGHMYIQSAAYSNGYVYWGTRNANPAFGSLNVKTGEKKIIEIPKFIDEYKDLKISAIYYITAVGKYIFPIVKTYNGIFLMLCFDTQISSFINLCEESLGGQHMSEPLDDKCYFIGADGNLKGFDLNTAELFDTGIEYLKYHDGDDAFDYANGYMGGGFFKLTDQEKYPGYTLITVNYDKNAFAYINLQNKSVEFVNPQGMPENAITLQALSKGLKDDIFIGGYMGVKVARYDLKTKEFTYAKVRQTEGIIPCNNKIYFGVYTRASVWEYDYAKPIIEDENPKPIFIVGQDQDRPFAMLSDENILILGTVPDYGKLGGALTIYDTISGEKKVIRNIVKDQTVTALTKKGSYIYGSTGIWGGLGSVPSQKTARMFIYDINTEKLILEKPLILSKKSDKIMYIGDIKFDNEGNLWAVSSGVVVRLDEKTLDVIDEIDIFGINWDINIPQWRPNYLRFSKNNMIYTNPIGNLVKINPKTLEVIDFKLRAQVFDIASDENLYFGDGSNLYKMRTII